MILSGVMMLRHLGEFEAADLIDRAVMYTLAEGKARTRDVVGDVGAAGTSAYTETVLSNFGKALPEGFVKPRAFKPIQMPKFSSDMGQVTAKDRQTVGLDVFVETRSTPAELGAQLEKLVDGLPIKLKMVSNRGTQVYPVTGGTPDTVDQYRCRFMLTQPSDRVADETVHQLLSRVSSVYRWMHVEKLQTFDGQPGFTKAQGED